MTRVDISFPIQMCLTESVFKVNFTKSELIDLEYRMLDLVNQLTELDSISLNQLMKTSLLSERTEEKMELQAY